MRTSLGEDEEEEEEEEEAEKESQRDRSYFSSSHFGSRE